MNKTVCNQTICQLVRVLRGAGSLALVLGSLLPASAQAPIVVPIPASGLLYDPVSRKIYASVGSGAGGDMTNSITVIDPVSGKVGPSVFVGSGPGAMTLSDQSKYLYVTVGDAGGVRRVNLPQMTSGPLYPMPGKPVRALLPLPGQPEAFIALRGNHTRYDDALGIYLNGQLQGGDAGCGPQVLAGIAPTRLFTYQNQLSSWDFDGYDVTAQGVNQGIARVSHTQSLLVGNVGLIGSINGLLLTNQGSLIDPEVRQLVGRLDFGGKSGTLLPDPRTGQVLAFAERKEGGQEIAVCDVRTFKYLGSVPVATGTRGGAGSIIRWGENGYAYTVGSSLVIVRLPIPLLPPVDLAVDRSALPADLARCNPLTYRLSVTNQGQARATNVFLSDAVPEGTDVLTMKPSQGSATAADGVVRVELGALAEGAKATVDVTLQFKEIKEIKNVRFTAVVRGHEPDPKTDNNVARHVASDALPPLPDLTGSWTSLRQVSTGAGVNLQSGILGQFSVRNEGRQIAPPVSLRFYVSPGPRFSAGTSLLLQEVRVPALRSGQSFRAGLEAVLGRGEDITGLYVFAIIDADSALKESKRDNNVAGQRVP